MMIIIFLIQGLVMGTWCRTTRLLLEIPLDSRYLFSSYLITRMEHKWKLSTQQTRTLCAQYHLLMSDGLLCVRPGDVDERLKWFSNAGRYSSDLQAPESHAHQRRHPCPTKPPPAGKLNNFSFLLESIFLYN